MLDGFVLYEFMRCYIFRILVIYLMFLLYIGRFCYMSSVLVIYLAFLLYLSHSCYMPGILVISIIRFVLRAVPLPALVRAFELIKTAHGVNPSGTTSGTKTGRPTHNEERPEKRNMRLNNLATRHRNLNYPVSEGNQEYENANTRIAPSSSQSPPECHQSAKL